MVKLNFTMALWGESFADTFLEYVLRFYLSPNNLPFVRSEIENCELILYLGQSVERTITNHKLYQQLADTISTRIIILENLKPSLTGNTYETLNFCHRHFIELSNRENAAMVFLCPDSIWSDGSFKEIVRHMRLGSRAILVAGLRTVLEDITAALARNPLEIRCRGLQPRELMTLAIRYPHRITQSLFWTSSQFDRGWPSHLLWPVRDEGYLCRPFHLHTLYVHPRTKNLPAISHDLDWLSQLGFRDEDVHIVQDSDELCVIEMSPRQRPPLSTSIGRSSILRVALWMHRHAKTDHRRYFKKTVYYHGSGIGGWAWKAAWLRAWFTAMRILALEPFVPAAFLLRRILRNLLPKTQSEN